MQKGDDILLSVITDGRHAAIDMRLVWHGSDDEPANKLNKLIDNVHRIWAETAAQSYLRPDGTPFPIPGAGQMIFSDLGTISVEATRGFSAYRWIRQQLIARGVPASQIAFMQDYKRSADKQRLFADFKAGRVRILIGSSDTMGTGVNVQQRLKAMHHLDVPWLPSADRAARGPHRAAGQPARRDRHLCLRDARLDGCHNVAEQRAQGAVHRGGAVRRPHDPSYRGCRQPGQSVRLGQGDCIG